MTTKDRVNLKTSNDLRIRVSDALRRGERPQNVSRVMGIPIYTVRRIGKRRDTDGTAVMKKRGGCKSKL